MLSPYLWADWGSGLEVCSRRIAPDDLITKSCYFQLQQLLYNFSHSSYPMLLATSINKLKIAVNSLKFGIACIISVYLFIICWKTYWMASTIISQKHRYWQSQPFFAFWVHTLWNLKHRIFLPSMQYLSFDLDAYLIFVIFFTLTHFQAENFTLKSA